MKIVSSVSRGKGVLFQNEFAACLAQLADTLMEPYSITYPKTWRRVHAIFGRLDFGNILELRKRLKPAEVQKQIDKAADAVGLGEAKEAAALAQESVAQP